jgi:hypothetical protein
LGTTKIIITKVYASANNRSRKTTYLQAFNQGEISQDAHQHYLEQTTQIMDVINQSISTARPFDKAYK